MSVCDLGSQNDFTREGFPFVSWEYGRREIEYDSIDVNGKGTIYHDLGTLMEIYRQYDMVVDAGTKEHVMNLDKAFLNQYNLTKKDGLMYCENPKVGSWPDHGFHYFTKDYYKGYSKRFNTRILVLEEHACNTSDDGWEIICLMRK